MALRKEIDGLKIKLELIQEEKLAQSQYLNKLHLLYNQYTSEIEKKELAIEGYITFNKYDDIGSLAGVTLITMAYYISLLLVGINESYRHPGMLIIDSPRKNLGAQASKNEDDELKDEKIFNATMKHLYEIAERNKECIQVIVVNNGYPDFIPNECVVAEFDSDQRNGLPHGLIDDAV